MKKIILSTMVLGSTVALAACGGTHSASDLHGALTQAPYAEERTVGATAGNVTIATPSIPAVLSAEPVFESSQVK